MVRQVYLAMFMLLVAATVCFPSSLSAESEAQIRFYAVPSYVEQSKPMVMEVWVEDPNAPGVPYTEFASSEIVVHGFWWNGGAWETAFTPFVVEALTFPPFSGPALC